MTEAMMEHDDREVIRLVQENRDVMGDAIPTRKGFVWMPEIAEEEPKAPVTMDEDRELERLVNANTAWYRQQEEASREEERQRLRCCRERDAQATRLWHMVREGAAALAPCVLGAAMLGGMTQGWVDAVFAAGLALVCFAWAGLRLRSVIHGGD